MSGRSVQIIGNYLSPYVRKVLVCLDRKGIDYRIDPIVPFFGNDEFDRISPLRRIPVLIDGALTLPDSSVICEYLEEREPDPPLLPKHPADRARSRWLEEYADSYLCDVIIWRLFDQLVIRRFVWGEEVDEEVVRRAREEQIPAILDHLEPQLPEKGYLFGELGIADIALASPLRNAAFARYSIDAERWPRAAAYFDRVLAHPSFARLRPFEELMLRTPIAQQREALRELGAPLSDQSFASATPRRGLIAR